MRAEAHGRTGQVIMLPDGLMMRRYQEPSFGQTDELGAAHGHGFQFTPGIINATEAVEEHLVQMWDTPGSEWLTLIGVVFSLVCLDAVLSKRLPGGYYKHVAMLVVWVLCGLGYNCVFFLRNGEKDGMDWFIGYVLEWMLSLDNLFAFQFILRAYRTPDAIQDKALFLGILGSIASRGVLFLVIGSVLKTIHYIQFAFGFFLVYAGIKSLNDEDDEHEHCDILLVRMLKSCLGSRLQNSYDLENHHLFVTNPEDGRLCATLMVPLIFCIIVSDVIFAVDSVTAKIGQIHNQYICYSSSVLALLGMRAMFHVINDLVCYFELLKYGICCILVFIGAELMVAGRFEFPEWVVMMIIVSVFNFCIVASLIKNLVYGAPGSDQRLAGEQMTSGKTLLTAAQTSTSRLGLPKGVFNSQSPELRMKLQTRFDAIERHAPAWTADAAPELTTADSAAGSADKSHAAAGNAVLRSADAAPELAAADSAAG